MAIARRIGEHRPAIIFIILIFLSFASLASGTRGERIGDGVRTVVGVVSMPFLLVVNRGGDVYAHVSGLVFAYNDMREAAAAMQFDLAELRQKTAADDETRAENARLRTMLAFQRRESRFTLMPAEVLQHSRGFLTIDRGSLHGVRESMCVISPDGVIGLVTQSGPFTASVITLQSPDCKIDAMVKWNRARGRVNGMGSELSAICAMHYIDLKHEVRKGDEVVTSPDSVFPSGYPIGRVVGVPRQGDLSQSVDILPAADPFRVDEVFVLLNASLDWEEMAGRTVVANTLDDSQDLLDAETIQERLAP